MKRIKNLYLVYLGFIFANISNAAVPGAKIIGPITAHPIGDPSRNFIYSASAIDLASQGYIEEEYFIEGMANQYTTPDLETGEVIDSSHRYLSRLIVRRPQKQDFNGIVIVE